MTATIATMYPFPLTSGWSVLFAENADKDLDFDEGFEEDELHQSKPPSRRPLIWLLLLIVVGAAAYWVLNNPSPPTQNTAFTETMEEISATPQGDKSIHVSAPLFSENQTVRLAVEDGETMLMGDPANTKTGPMVQTSEHLTILDGLPQLDGWVYQVKTQSGKSGWVSEDKLKKS